MCAFDNTAHGGHCDQLPIGEYAQLPEDPVPESLGSSSDQPRPKAKGKAKVKAKAMRRRRRDPRLLALQEDAKVAFRCSCGNVLADEDLSCQMCGAKRKEARSQPTCTCTCGKTLDDDELFCPACGTKRQDEDGQPEAPAEPEQPTKPEKPWHELTDMERRLAAMKKLTAAHRQTQTYMKCEGVWARADTLEYIATIEDLFITWQGHPWEEMQMSDDGKLQWHGWGSVYTAQINNRGELVWNDGDVWIRMDGDD